MDVRFHKQPTGWGKLAAALGLMLAAGIALSIVSAVMLVPAEVQVLMAGGELSGLEGLDASQVIGAIAVAQLVVGAVALLFVALLGGGRLVRPRAQGVRATWRMASWLIAADVVVLLVSVVAGAMLADPDAASSPDGIPASWPLNLLLIALFCLGTGIFEESMFRGLLLNGLLARMGTNAKGVVWAVVASSLVFGAMHVVGEDVAQLDALAVVQALLKVVQTGIFGFVLAVAVLKTRGIWGAVTVHAAGNFLLMFMFAFADPGELSRALFEEGYVSAGDDGLWAVATYAATCVLYLPAFISALRQLKALELPCRGAFYAPRISAAAPVVPDAAMPDAAMPGAVVPGAADDGRPPCDEPHPVPPQRL